MSKYSYDMRDYFTSPVITHELQDIINDDDNIIPKLLYIDTCDNMMYLNFTASLSLTEEKYMTDTIFNQYNIKIESGEILDTRLIQIHQIYISEPLLQNTSNIVGNFIFLGTKFTATRLNHIITNIPIAATVEFVDTHTGQIYGSFSMVGSSTGMSYSKQFTSYPQNIASIDIIIKDIVATSQPHFSIIICGIPSQN